FSDYGNQDHFMPYLRKDPVFQYTANFTKIQGAHEFKWGFDLNNQWMNHIQPEFAGGESMGPRGRFNFRRGVVQTFDIDGDKTPMSSREGSFATATTTAMITPISTMSKGAAIGTAAIVAVPVARVEDSSDPSLEWLLLS
ncbi:MAG: hypothetical protein V3U70_02560, partial [Thermoplasmata archaeon]